MVAEQRRFEPKLAIIAAGVVVLIVYGSLYPFDFHHTLVTEPLRALLGTWSALPTRANFISNLLLYIPLGFFLVRSGCKALSVTLLGMALSISVEFAQFYERSRDPGMFDIYTNTAGTLLGALAGACSFRQPFVVILVACWLGNRLFAHVPPRSPLDIYRQAVTWLAIAVLLESRFGVVRSRRALLAFVPAMLLTRIVAALFVGVVVIEALEPFQFRDAGRSFGLIPFRSFIEGPRESGIPVFLEKTFTYGTLIWLVTRAGCRFEIATAFGALLVLCLRIAQVYLPGRSAEITDVTMLLVIAATMKLMDEVLGPPAPRAVIE